MARGHTVSDDKPYTPVPPEVLHVKDELCKRGVLDTVAEYAFKGHWRFVEDERNRVVRNYSGVYDPQVLALIMDDYVAVAMSRRNTTQSG